MCVCVHEFVCLERVRLGIHIFFGIAPKFESASPDPSIGSITTLNPYLWRKGATSVMLLTSPITLNLKSFPKPNR